MSARKNIPPEETNPASDGKTENPPPSASAGTERLSPAGGASCSGAKKVWGWLLRVLDYLDEEAPERPESVDAPESKLKRCWKRFNAFLDSLDENAEGTGAGDESRADTGERTPPAGTLKKAGGVLWTILFHIALAFFLFVLTMYGTVKTLDFVEEHRLKLYPADEVTEYLAAAHATLEETVSGLPPATGECEEIPFDRFDAKTLEMLKPLKIYRDKYGVYIMTAKSWYAGEHGIFIAHDADNMPPMANWGLIEGRVFAYGIFE